MLSAPNLTFEGTAIPGRGGEGGHAVVVGRDDQAEAQGGRGGDGGLARLNDLVLPDVLPGLPDADGWALPPEVCLSAGAMPGVSVTLPRPCIRVEDPDQPYVGAVTLGVCIKPAGEKGHDKLTTNGGRGGDACVDLSGGDASDGNDGQSGWWNCSDGAHGGNAGHAASSAARGGDGGTGNPNGGDGGDGRAISRGGNGGAGGDGGGSWLGNCKGGNGGHGGNGATATAFGGNGGLGCRFGGVGGQASADAMGGAGGPGGAGNPSGAPGLPGLSGQAWSQGGQSGVGLGVC